MCEMLERTSRPASKQANIHKLLHYSDNFKLCHYNVSVLKTIASNRQIVLKFACSPLSSLSLSADDLIWLSLYTSFVSFHKIARHFQRLHGHVHVLNLDLQLLLLLLQINCWYCSDGCKLFSKSGLIGRFITWNIWWW